MASIETYITEENRPYWEALTAGELHLQRCSACRYIRHPAKLACPECLSESFNWEAMSGQASVQTFIWYMQEPEASVGTNLGLQTELPYNVAVVRLDEGPSLLTNIKGVAFGDLQVGQQVVPAFDDVNGTPWSVLRFSLEE